MTFPSRVNEIFFPTTSLLRILDQSLREGVRAFVSEKLLLNSCGHLLCITFLYGLLTKVFGRKSHSKIIGHDPIKILGKSYSIFLF